LATSQFEADGDARGAATESRAVSLEPQCGRNKGLNGAARMGLLSGGMRDREQDFQEEQEPTTRRKRSPLNVSKDIGAQGRDAAVELKASPTEQQRVRFHVFNPKSVLMIFFTQSIILPI